MSIPYTVSVQAVWRKDQKRVESKGNPLIGGKQVTKTSFHGEVLSMISTIQKDKQKGNLSEKMSQVVIKITKGDKSRSFGLIDINLAEYVHDEQIS